MVQTLDFVGQTYLPVAIVGMLAGVWWGLLGGGNAALFVVGLAALYFVLSGCSLVAIALFSQWDIRRMQRLAAERRRAGDE